MLNFIASCSKSVGFFLILCIFSAHSVCGSLLLRHNPLRRRRFNGQIVSGYSKVALRLLGVQVNVKRSASVPARLDSGCLVVSNHLSYLDVPIIASLLPSVFVTSVETRESPLTGLLSLLGGCLFTERRKRGELLQEVARAADLLKKGMNIAVFPEATSSNGDGLLPFRPALFDAALKAEAPVLILCLSYSRLDDGPVTLANRDRLFYHGEMKFLPHLIQLMRIRKIQAHLEVLEVFHDVRFTARKDLAARAHRKILAAYEKRPSGAALPLVQRLSFTRLESCSE